MANSKQNTTKRIYGKTEQRVDFGCIKDLYADRAQNVSNPLNAVMLQSDQSKLPELRNKQEKIIINEYLDFNSSNILDIGCGAGRLAGIIPDNFMHYTGIDFSQELLSLAQKEYSNRKNINFLCLDLKEEMNHLNSVIPNKIDVLFLVGIFMYYNDCEIEKTLQNIIPLLADDCSIYLRETISVTGKRLTLDNFYSSNLDTEYSSIYRTEEEYLSLLSPLLGMNFKQVRSDFFPQELATYKETQLKYFIYQR